MRRSTHASSTRELTASEHLAPAVYEYGWPQALLIQLVDINDVEGLINPQPKVLEIPTQTAVHIHSMHPYQKYIV